MIISVYNAHGWYDTHTKPTVLFNWQRLDQLLAVKKIKNKSIEICPIHNRSVIHQKANMTRTSEMEDFKSFSYYM